MALEAAGVLVRSSGAVRLCKNMEMRLSSKWHRLTSCVLSPFFDATAQRTTLLKVIFSGEDRN